MLVTLLSLQYTEIEQGTNVSIDDTTQTLLTYKIYIPQSSETHTSFFFTQYNSSTLSFYYCITQDDCKGKGTHALSSVNQVNKNTTVSTTLKISSGSTTNTSYIGDAYLFIQNLNQVPGVVFIVDTAEIIYERLTHTCNPTVIQDNTPTINESTYQLLYYSCSDASVKFTVESTQQNVSIFFESIQAGGYLTKDCSYVPEITICVDDALSQQETTIPLGLWRVTISTIGTDPLNITFIETNTTMLNELDTTETVAVQKSIMCSAYVQASLSSVYSATDNYNITFSASSISESGEQSKLDFRLYTDIMYISPENFIGSTDDGMYQIDNTTYSQWKNNGSIYQQIGLILTQNDSTYLFSDSQDYTYISVQMSTKASKQLLNETYTTTVSPTNTTQSDYRQINTLYNSINIIAATNLNDDTEEGYTQSYVNNILVDQTNYNFKPQITYDSINNFDANQQVESYESSALAAGYWTSAMIGNQNTSSSGITTISPKSIIYTGFQYSANDSASQQNVTVIENTNILTTINANTLIQFQNEKLSPIYFQVLSDDSITQAGGYFISCDIQQENTVTIYYSTTNPLPDKNDNEGQSETSNGHAELQLDNTTSDIYIGIEFTGTATDSTTNYFYAVPLDQKAKSAEPDQEYTISLSSSQTEQYYVPFEGILYNQQQAFIKVKYNNLSETFGDGNISFVVCSQFYEGEATKCPSENILTTGYLNVNEGIKVSTETFKNRVDGYIYVTFTNFDNATHEIIFQLSHPTQLQDNINVLVQFSSDTAEYSYLQFDASARDDIKLTPTMSTSSGETAVASYFICRFDAPLISELHDTDYCYNGTFTNGKEVELSDQIHQSGNYYLVILRVSEQDTQISLLMLQSKYLEINQQVSIKTTTGGDEYYYINLEDGQYGKAIYLGLVSCQNCLICASETDHPQFYSFPSSSYDNMYCQTVLGNVSYDTTIYNISYKQNDIINDQQNVFSKLYLTIRSMESYGISQSIVLRADVAEGQIIDTPFQINMKYSNVVDSVTLPSTGKVYSKANYDFIINCNSLQNDEISLTVTPTLDQSNPQSARYLFEAQYTIYTSLTTMTPDLESAYAYTVYQNGISFVQFNTQDIKNQWCTETSTTAHIYALIKASDLMSSEIVPTTITLNSHDPNDIVHSAPFNTPIDVEGTAGERRLEQFEVTDTPMQFTITTCKGNPHVRAGITDYYTRSTYTGENQTDAGLKLYVSDSNHTQADGDIIVRIGGGQYLAFTGDYVIEIGDDNNDFLAHLKIGNDDVNPGVPIKTLIVGKQDGNILAHFAPALPVQKDNSQQDLEYSMYIVPQYDEQDKYFNPYAACGYTVGGFQMTPWTTFGDYQDFYVLTSNYSTSDYNDYIKQQNTSNYYITVVVRQKSTQFLNIYRQQLIDINNVPDYPFGNDDKVALGVIIGCTVGAVVIICAIIGGVFLYKRKQAKNPYQFDSKVNWDE